MSTKSMLYICISEFYVYLFHKYSNTNTNIYVIYANRNTLYKFITLSNTITNNKVIFTVIIFEYILCHTSNFIVYINISHISLIVLRTNNLNVYIIYTMITYDTILIYEYTYYYNDI